MRKIYITTAIPYVNSQPHIGHAYLFMLADVVARYQRMIGNEVFFVSGTDENSLKNVLAAEKAGEPIENFVDRHSKNFYKLKDTLNLSFDDFIRTTEKRHIEGAQKMWLAAKEDIYQSEYEGYYCVGCEDFKKDDDLVDGLCPYHKSKPELIKEKNYFFKLSKYNDFLKNIIESKELEIVPSSRQGELASFFKEGLRDFSISRSQERARNWGILVPDDPSQVIYVWFDALCNYITALGYAYDSPLYRAWWEDEKTEVWHFLGKDITKFHTLYWPAMLKSAGLRLPKKTVVHSFFTVEGEKISKSLGNAISPFELVEEFGADTIRYYTLRELSLVQDGNFSRTTLLERYNNELANGLGNLLSRVTTMIERNGGEVKINVEKGVINKDHSLLLESIEKTWADYDKSFSDFRINQAVDSWLRIIGVADAFINLKKPWEIENKEELESILSSLWLLLANLTAMVDPFMPETAEKMKQSLGLEKIYIRDISQIEGNNTFRVKRISNLFPRKD